MPGSCFGVRSEGIGVGPGASASVDAEKEETLDERIHGPLPALITDAATREILDNLSVRLVSGMPVLGIGHRVVHGGVQICRAGFRLDLDDAG